MAAGHGAQKDRCSVATRRLLAATAKGCGREKRVENKTRRDERRIVFHRQKIQSKPARGATSRGIRAAGQALQRLPCPLSCLSKWAFACCNFGPSARLAHETLDMQRSTLLTAAVGWPHVSQSAATPARQASNCDVQAETRIRQVDRGRN